MGQFCRLRDASQHVVLQGLWKANVAKLHVGGVLSKALHCMYQWGTFQNPEILPKFGCACVDR